MLMLGCKGSMQNFSFFHNLAILPLVKFPHSPILLKNKSVFPMAMYCFSHCFLYPRTECIMQDAAVRKFYPSFLGNFNIKDQLVITCMIPNRIRLYSVLLPLLIPNGDKHHISLKSITPKSNVKVMRIKKMITNSK